MEKLDRIIVVDLETTGPSFEQGDRIIQLGAIVIQNNQIVEKFSMYLNPEQAIPSNIQLLTGIQQNQVDNAPTFKSVALLWFKRFENAVIIAHNLNFDLNYLKQAFWDAGLIFEPKYAIDTLTLSKILLPTAVGFNLTDLAAQCNIPFDGAHNALNDALVTGFILSEYSILIGKTKESIRYKLTELSTQLEDDAAYFFSFYQQFFINSITKDDTSKMMGHQSVNFLADWTLEEWKNHQQLLLVNSKHLFSKNYMRELTAKIEEKLIIITDNPQQINIPFTYLRYKRDFISIDGVNWLVENFTELNLNHQEKIQILALYYWLYRTETGIIEELHNDINAGIILDKYVPKAQQKNREYFYRKYLRQLKNATKIVVTTFEIDKLKHFIDKKQFDQSQWRLLVADSKTLIDGVSYFGRNSLNISQFFTMLQEELEIYNPNSADYAKLETDERLLNLLHQVNNLLKKSQSILRKQDEQFVTNQVTKTIILRINQKKEIVKRFNLILNEIVVLNKLVSLENTRLKQMIDQIIRYLSNLNQYSISDLEMFIEAQMINLNYYQITIVYQDIEKELALLHQLQTFENVLILDNGWYRIENPINIVRSSFYQKMRLLSIPDLYYPKHKVFIPFAYMNGFEEIPEVASSSNVTDFQKETIELIKQFLNEEALSNKMIVITANKASSALLYAYLNQTKITTHYLIEAANITGNSKRVMRKFREHERMIGIFSRNEFEKLQSINNNDINSVLIQTLPFDVPSDDSCQLLMIHHNWRSEQLFSNYLLPKMRWKLKKELLQLFEENNQVKVYLFDERIFTKYYSNSIRDYLGDSINFEISD